MSIEELDFLEMAPPATENGHHQNGVVSRSHRRPEGPAGVLGIGTAVPPFVFEQSTYPDYYFDETNCSHKTELKAKFKRICKYTGNFCRVGIERFRIFLVLITSGSCSLNARCCLQLESSWRSKWCLVFVRF